MDQNDKVGKKFGKIRFRQLVKDTCQKPLKIQKIELENALQAHMTLTSQRDDIMVAGFTFFRPEPDPRVSSHFAMVRDKKIST
jgi:hypothetical protein